MRDKFNSAKKRVSTVTTHVYRNRGRYCFAAGAATTVYVLNKTDRVSEWKAFLEEKGLTAEFYLPED